MLTLSRWMLTLLLKRRAERHSGCRIDVARLRTDPEYASAIRVLAQFTLDAELESLGALAGTGRGGPPAARSILTADVLPLRRAATA
jgi:hypothetical protein